MNEVEYLIISSTHDYSTDLVCCELNHRKKKYLRINRDRFQEYDIIYSLENNTIEIKMDGKQYLLKNDNILGIYFRAPVFLRSHKKYLLNEQLIRSQWSAFIRNLVVFDKAKWINNPVDTYKAENKMYQLKCANDIGLMTPKTYVGNIIPDNIVEENNYIVKSLDTALFYNENQELFTYSSIISGKELKLANIKDAPIILQECLENKLDLRVTVIGDKLFPVSITCSGSGIVGDWRKNKKDTLTYNCFDLPDEIRTKILMLMKKLNLSFGGVDLILKEDKYYFIEVNPTGEWGWLESANFMPISSEIVNALIKGDNI